MTFRRIGKASCLGTLACGCLLIGCLGAENLEEDAAPDIGQASQALVDTELARNGAGSAEATCTLSTFTADLIAQLECLISDTANDDHSVYVDWSLDSFSTVRLSNHEGAGSTVSASEIRQNQDGPFQIIRWKVCTDVQLFGDDCSDTLVYEL